MVQRFGCCGSGTSLAGALYELNHGEAVGQVRLGRAYSTTGFQGSSMCLASESQGFNDGSQWIGQGFGARIQRRGGSGSGKALASEWCELNDGFRGTQQGFSVRIKRQDPRASGNDLTSKFNDGVQGDQAKAWCPWQVNSRTGFQGIRQTFGGGIDDGVPVDRASTQRLNRMT